ncbi:MAG TPA: gamma-glutamyl-gamma-aminobutyrate hydrolase family protein [Burkholderiaceae bacterium]|nr:gamma-glutamyl-gamma-aminobutyrate hydrolase family protein [Burkholderiaceae bacterium]
MSRGPSPASPKPRVLVPACNRMLGSHSFHVAGREYIAAVRIAGCQPLVLPNALPDEIDGLLDLADGVLLTGSASNVHPRHFGQTVYDATLPLDEKRDASTLALIPRLLARGIPLLAICRGLQETNVALGGSLHQAVQEVEGRRDHRSPKSSDLDVRYGPAHEVMVEPGGVLDRLVGEPSFRVNSLHGQGVDRLAAGLHVEARALDGPIEAFSVAQATGFNLCVQWHPEWQAATNPVSKRLLEAFGEACGAFRAHRVPSLSR